MVSLSRQYFALLASVATVAFWLFMWSSSVANFQPLGSPKPYVIYYQHYEETKSIPISSAPQKKATSPKKTKSSPKSKFGQHKIPPVTRSLFPFSAMSPKAKKNPFEYGARLISYRLALEETKKQSYFQLSPPKTLLEIPSIEAKWKIAPQFRIGEAIPVENAANILIATSWRSGSTFLGDLLNHYPGTFYSFEPVHYINRGEGENWLAKDGIQLIRDLYHCNFTTNFTIGYLKHASKNENQFLLKHNGRIWKSCASLLPSNVGCFMPQLFEKSCHLFPVRVIKTVRMRLKYIEELMNEADLNLKTIVLVRDPRGTMKSRNEFSWCSDAKMCGNLSVVCHDLDEDVDKSYELAEKYPDRIILIRYEDLCIEPYETVDKLIHFLDLPPRPEFIDHYLATHTGSVRSGSQSGEKLPQKNDGAYGTKRKSSEQTAFKWAKTASQESVEEIEKTCQVPMEKLGYAQLEKDSDILFKTAEEIWPYE